MCYRVVYMTNFVKIWDLPRNTVFTIPESNDIYRFLSMDGLYAKTHIVGFEEEGIFIMMPLHGDVIPVYQTGVIYGN